MANLIKWGALGSFTTIINGEGTAPTLKNLANNGQKIGSEVDGSTNRDQFADFDLYCRFQVAPSAGGYVALYLIQAIDGSAYADGDDSVAPPATSFVGNFPVRAVTTQQRVALRGVSLPATKWKPLAINKSGQAMTNTNDENILRYRAYNPEVQ